MSKNLARAFTAGGGAMSPIVSVSNDPGTRISDDQAAAIEDMARARTKWFREAAFTQSKASGNDPYADEDYLILEEIEERKGLLESEQARLRVLFRRLDNMYYPERVTSKGGADHWPEDIKPGRVHVSINTPPVYVDIPASLQAVTPIENGIAASSEQEERDAIARVERLYFEWKDEAEFELLVHKACVVKALYGFTYAKVMWDSIEKRPAVSLIDSPENLYVGWATRDFNRIDWTIYCYGMSPQAIAEDFGLSVEFTEREGEAYPVVTAGSHADPIRTVTPDTPQGELRGARPPTAYEDTFIEVYDYWYKKSRGKGKRPEIWNAIYVGNKIVKNARHREYEDIPYIALPNTYIPGSPYGRPELYDIEQIIREKDERVTNAAQMLETITGGQMWQLVGPDAQDDVPPNAIPKPNKVATPGAGAEIKAIQPFIPQYAIEDYLKRLDAEAENITGLNELLMGRAPATILGSSKAIAALVANYEARIKMKRDLLYQWRKRVWRAVAKVWEAKDADVREIIDGRYRLDVQPPELTPRDELENAQKALNLLQNRAWSLRRVMDATGVEDPEDEITLIREEQTDAALNPAAVQSQATLLSLLQQLGIKPPEQSVNAAQNAARTLNRPVQGGQSLNAPENQGNPPAETVPANAQAGNGARALSQTILQEGEAGGRVVTQAPL